MMYCIDHSSEPGLAENGSPFRGECWWTDYLNVGLERRANEPAGSGARCSG